MSEWVEDKLEEIQTVLEAISELDNVYKRSRWSNDPAVVKKLFAEILSGKRKRINTWMIGREGVIENGPLAQVRYIAVHTFIIKGYLSFNDEKDTESELNVMIDKIRAALRGNQTIWDVCSEVVQETPQVRLVGYAFLGEVFCNYCEIALEVEEHKIVTN